MRYLSLLIARDRITHREKTRSCLTPSFTSRVKQVNFSEVAAPVGLEPTTYGLTIRYSTNWTTGQYKLNDYICIYRGASHHSRGLLHSYLFSLTTSEVSDLHRIKAYTRSTTQHDLRNYFLYAFFRLVYTPVG